MEINGTFPKVTKSTPGITYQAPLGRPIDAGIDGHGTIIPGNLPEWSKIPAISAKLAEFGITGDISPKPRADGWTDGGEAFEHMRGHVGKSGRAMVREFRDLVRSLGLAFVDESMQGSDGTTINDYPGAPPLSGPGSVYERLAVYGLITSATPYDGPMPSQKRLAEIYYKEKLVPGQNEEQWMRDERGLRPLPERWAAPENGVELFRKLERSVGAWGLAVAEGASNGDVTVKRATASADYLVFIAAWIPAEFAGAPPAFGDREYNPRSLFYAADRIENAIAQNNPTAAATSGPRCAFALGAPQVFSLYEGEGMRQTAQPLQAAEWKMYLGLPPAGDSGSGGGVHVGGR